MGTIPLPPWLRRIQQSFYWQYIALPVLIGFGGMLLLNNCQNDLTQACLILAAKSYVLLTVGNWIKGHSIGSTSFANDGSPIVAAPALKALADKTAVVVQQAADPAIPEVKAAEGALAENALGDVTRAINQSVIKVNAIATK